MYLIHTSSFFFLRSLYDTLIPNPWWENQVMGYTHGVMLPYRVVLAVAQINARNLDVIVSV